MMRKIYIYIIIILHFFICALSQANGTRGLEVVIKDKQGQVVRLYEESHALVIGVSDYTGGWSRLPGVKTDVKAVQKLLENNGFTVTTVLNPTKEEMQKVIDAFIASYGRTYHNRLLIYYSGHGYTLKQTWGGEMGYIVPVDAPNPHTDKGGFLNRAVDMEMIEVYAKRIQSKHALFLFDSCFSGSIFTLTKAAPSAITHKASLPVRQFITAGSAEEEVPDESIFRRQFEAALRGEADGNKDGYVTVSELGEYLQTTVVNYSHDTQHPQYGKIQNPFLDKGDFIFQLWELEPEEPIPGPVEPGLTGFDASKYEDLANEHKTARAKWEKLLADIKMNYDKLLKLSSDGDVPSKLKVAAWKEFVSKSGVGQDNPYTDEDDKMRNQAGLFIEEWKAEEKRERDGGVTARAKWDKLLADIQTYYGKLLKLNGNGNASSKMKVAAWKEFVSKSGVEVGLFIEKWEAEERRERDAEAAARAKWDKLLADIRTYYDKLLKLNSDGDTSPKMKIAAWKEFVSKPGVDQDNPYTDEDDKMRNQVGLFIEKWEAEERRERDAEAAARAKWDKLLADIQTYYDKLLKLNSDGDTSPKMKIAAWKEFVSKPGVGQENPYTDEDDKMRNQAGLFIEEWEAEERREREAEIAERAKWDKLLADIKVNYYNLLKLNGDGNTLPKMKVAAWKEFVSKSRVDQDNPYTDEDDKMHKQAGLFIEEWEAEERLEGGTVVGETWRDPITGMEFVWVPGGSFEMGDLFGEGNADEKYLQQVTITGFWMGKYEVTQGQWKKVMNDNPSYFKSGDDYPVERVSWNDIQEFMRKINSTRYGKCSFRLPTGAEWEYACREGGKKVRFGNGQDILDPQKANFNGDGRYKEPYSLAGEYRKKTTPVGTFPPNKLGLHDMSGNLWEWTQDSYEFPNSTIRTVSLSNNNTAACRVIRGGSWNFRPYSLRATHRDYFPSDAKLYDCGFRLVLSANKQNDTKIIR
ncbi:MAG TPA: SUMF1/EgtB/PvdO family nonheme iron enzyme [Candidatus Wunengus sp. YC63]|uniref:SUMF1/EgtB/PvdO family nonheme iron enzyme n=1 Tax=Candidatus Wunengus sp. YC63 TaxID=3367699 RepID=UPI00402524F9